MPSDSPSGVRRSLDVSARRRWLALGSAIVLVPAALFLLASVANHGRVPKGTTVEGIAIGGLTPEAAKVVLTKQLVPRTNKPVIVVADASRVAVEPQAAGVAIDVDATVSEAASGRGPLTTIAGLFGKAGPVDPALKVDDNKLKASVVVVVRKLSRASVEGGIDFVQSRAVAIEPVAGRSVDPASVAGAIEGTVGARDRTVEVATTVQSPQLSSADVAEAVKTLGATVVSGPVAIRVKGTSSTGPVDETVTVPIRRLSPYLGTQVVDAKLAIVVDASGVMKELQSDLGRLEVPAQDATFRIVNGKPVVVPSRDGNSVGKGQLGSTIAAAVSSRDSRVAAVTLTAQPAALTTAAAKKLGVVEELSSFRQPFPYAAYRKQNIGQASKRINGTLLLPGQTFSLNDTVLERTPANGYTTGFVISGGRLAEDLGGGVSTSATATWHAAFFAGLERVEQRAHSFYIARYRAGLEATVAWGSLDLRFKNDSPNGVFITSQSGSNFITVTMYGTKRYDITADSGPRTNQKAFRSQTDTSATCTRQSGVGGFRIVVTRVFSVAGKEVKREPLTTRYNPANDITCKKPAATPAPSAPPAASAALKPAATPKSTG